MQLDLSRRTLDTFDVGEYLVAHAAANHSKDAPYPLTVMQITHLDLSFNMLHVVSGFGDLSHLRVLNLSHNVLSSLEGELPPRLSNLNVSYNKISCLEPGALQPLRKLQVFDISFNCLTNLRGLPTTPDTLRVLNACGNQLETLRGIERCVALEELYANKNALKEATELSTLASLTHLRVLTLSENPIMLFPPQLQAIHAFLPHDLEQTDIPHISVVQSTNASPRLATTTVAVVMRQGDEVVRNNEPSEDAETLASIPSSGQVVQPQTSYNAQQRTQLYSSQKTLQRLHEVDADEVHTNSAFRTSVGLASRSCSQEGVSETQRGFQSPNTTQEKVAREAHQNTRGSQPVGAAWQLVYKRVMAERDASRQQVETMQKEIHNLKQLLNEQREATDTVLRINEQLKKRVLHTLAKGERREVATQCNTIPKVGLDSNAEGTDYAKRLDVNPQKRNHAASPRLTPPRTATTVATMSRSPPRIPPLAPRLLPGVSPLGGKSPEGDSTSRSIPRPHPGRCSQQPRSQSVPVSSFKSPSLRSPLRHKETAGMIREHCEPQEALGQHGKPDDVEVTREGSSGEPPRDTRKVATVLMSLLRQPGPRSAEFLL
ncbi:unnamed protein product [Phytomonas sp. EM1]|nr:unnamed protein product [Phytomonas sp. EM1]|eukprot:CCW60426.1 unnamed protein product [Phytomonas sp. isolate EM1]